MINNMINNGASQVSKMFGRIAPGLCRISTNGIAIKTTNGYKVYDVNSGVLVNCADFVFDIGDDMFFYMPTNNIVKGDIIISGGKPVCVISVNDNKIEAFRYEDSSIINIVPENMIFFGNTYFYSKIVSMFGDMGNGVKPEKIMPLLFMSEIMKGNDTNKAGFGSSLAQYYPLMMMMNGGFNFNNIFGNMFNSATSEKENKDVNSNS